MPYQLPTEADLSILVDFISQETVSSTAEEYAHLCQPLRDACEAILGVLNESAELCRCCGETSAENSNRQLQEASVTTAAEHITTAAMASAATFDHKLFFAPHRSTLQRIQTVVKTQLPMLDAECKEHGLMFGGDIVKTSYLSFVEGARSLERWSATVLELLDAPSAVPQASIHSVTHQHDVTVLYANFRAEANLYYQPDVTQYDARIQRRLLIPQYFASLREMLRRLETEIERLASIATVLDKPSGTTNSSVLSSSQQQPPQSVVVFKPPLTEFRFLYESTGMYLASSIIEDELTTVSYYRIRYDACERDVKQTAIALTRLPKPKKSAVTATAAAAAAKAVGSQKASPFDVNEVTDVPTATTTADVQQAGVDELGLTPGERASAEIVFDVFTDNRSKVRELAAELREDMKRKNATHCTRLPPVPVAPKPVVAPPSTTWLAAVKRLASGAVKFATCNAEAVDTTQLYSRTSPLFPVKQQLLQLVEQLECVVEAQADKLEAEYPGVFFRDWKSRLGNATSEVLKKFQAVTVVFDT